MSNIQGEHGNAKIIHHSTSSTVEIIVGKSMLHLDYQDFEDLARAFRNAEDNGGVPMPDPAYPKDFKDKYQ